MKPSILDRLRNPNLEVVLGALSEAARYTEDISDEVLLPAIADQLHSRHEVARDQASFALVQRTSGLLPPSILPRLIEALRDSSPIVRARMLECLQRVPASEELRPSILPLLHDADDVVRIKAAIALWYHVHDDRLVEPAIHAGLQSGDTHCVSQSCRLIASLGSSGQKHVPELLQLLRHANGFIRGNALNAVSRVVKDRSMLLQIVDSLENDPESLVQVIRSRIRRRLHQEGKD